ncbi:bifunctional serine/threonine-protein kinase/ABC transporter substrate-binding protein [Iningainema tapete]|uniref:non-specific serine/threonine protein kinase n=1 Tax=Iningainema tapete BLCC-T55 TaxID=2748662 RepID=A0A8J6XJJ0_9CYAN|nr:bifunctional serine/threonine-protein kinase/ABC transporter substrate-binding protein [Iningainema tapete]MBD2778070.1 ABC transporter substrate-binding protein [Iningainema tapete BLCC-T55]
MSYCINPACQNPHNGDSELFCLSCGSELLLQGRYRVVRYWQERKYTHIYQVIDTIQAYPIAKVLKVLKPISRLENKLVELFEREAKVLQELNHPGIPKGDGHFIFKAGQKPEPLHCLVMEKIDGSNLEEYIQGRKNSPISQELAVAWLIKLATILEKVHEHKIIHRDIKPSNIMLRPNGTLVLIDFGTAREITLTYSEDFEEQEITRVCSTGYTAPEQLRGQAVLQSDFFSLGRTFVYLLTGRTFTNHINLLNWRQNAQISPTIAELIDDLMAELPENRPQDTKIIIQRLAELQENLLVKTTFNTTVIESSHNIIQPRQSKLQQFIQPLSKRIIPLVGVFAILSSTLVIYKHLNVINGCAKPLLSSMSTGDSFSCGEEILIANSGEVEKNEGTEAYKIGNYSKAVEKLKIARQKQPSDPEVLIYLNNALIEVNKVNAPTIAAIAPISNSPEIATELLKGVAHAQYERVKELKKNPKAVFKVLIADDANDPNQARQVAESLANQSNILAVIGHNSSEIALATMDIFERRQLVLMSPGSTSANLPRPGDKFFFRTIPTVRVKTSKLANYLVNQARQKKVAVFSNPHSDFSNSFQEQFYGSFTAISGEIIEQKFDLSNPFFNASAAIKEARKQGATAFVIITDGGTNRYTFLNALRLIKANQGRNWIMGANSVAHQDVLLVGQEAVNRLVMTIPWIEMTSSNKEFLLVAKSLWQGEELNYRTASAYDATQALIKVLETTPNLNRLEVQKVLSNPNFRAKGATGVISFLPNGDRQQPLAELVKVVASQCSKYGYMFVPVEYKQLESACQQKL